MCGLCALATVRAGKTGSIIRRTLSPAWTESKPSWRQVFFFFFRTATFRDVGDERRSGRAIQKVARQAVRQDCSRK